MNRLSLIPCVALLAAGAVSAQSYTAVDLTPNGSGAASSASAGLAAGYASSAASAFVGRATLWTGDSAVDLHPDAIVGPGRSTVNGFAGNLQVGSAASASTGNRNIPIVWSGTAASATVLPIPFVNAGGQANATDGLQIVGSAIGLNRDGTTLGSTHALIWDVATGAATDIGLDANLYGVAGGQQVGIVLKALPNATLWRGTKAATSLHPKNAVVSYANATDGVRQVGYAGFNVRIRQEAANGNKDKRFNYAHVWNGTAASGLNIHAGSSSFDGAVFEHSYATSVSGSFVAGYATDLTKIGTPAYNRAIVWDAAFNPCDLSAFLPAGFVGSIASAVDADGNVAGVMTKADGTRHAVLWVLNPAQ
jgi:hypothetical protein